ncbi:hypothetical protein M5K25_006084 [Dendrobium thyrsiflorum]|uniref:FAE domain-containing protein n=1 Tax=Dendrobium thyrsiflorum TaxID=117978 RepID=A0ABD0VHM4_DENTH
MLVVRGSFLSRVSGAEQRGTKQELASERETVRLHRMRNCASGPSECVRLDSFHLVPLAPKISRALRICIKSCRHGRSHRLQTSQCLLQTHYARRRLLHANRHQFQFHANSIALIVSMEIITPNFYAGNQRSMLLPNYLFHMGATAILLSNRRRAKYCLVHLVRTHKGANEKAYHCVYEGEDKDGHSEISLSKDLMAITGEALKSNITTTLYSRL